MNLHCSVTAEKCVFNLHQQMLSSSWDGWPFGHNRHRPKIGGCAPFWGSWVPI